MYRLVLTLLCLSNVLNIVLPRYDDTTVGAASSGVSRLPIQVLGALTFAVVLYCIALYKNKEYKGLIFYVKCLVGLVLLWVVMSVVLSAAPMPIISNNLRLLTWLCCIVFFIRYIGMDRGKNDQLVRIYIITFILSATKKIFEVATFDSEALQAGDVAGLTLVLTLPTILLYFKNNYRNILLVFVVVIICATLRRTAIIALVLSFPFIFREIRGTLKRGHFFLFILIFLVGAIVAWQYFGASLTQRFTDLINGDSSYTYSDSFGSGRSIFYLIILNSWLDSNLVLQFFGHGLIAVSELLSLKYVAIGHAHNDLLETLYVYGLVGFSLYVCFVYQLIKFVRSQRKISKKYISVSIVSVMSFLIIALASGTLYKIEMVMFSLTIGTLANRVKLDRTKNIKPVVINENG